MVAAPAGAHTSAGTHGRSPSSRPAIATTSPGCPELNPLGGATIAPGQLVRSTISDDPAGQPSPAASLRASPLAASGARASGAAS